ncbi:cytochrome P450 [Radiomyces spectabilis]|uniref:cytochrome P450 n=1 Tax=Radiomyces spectabilis TaxID=64574 RepID=UPI0022200D33|nr:cytochrome P450 [Radiomyces spectabilis]KAI8376546.1 cytochrome P450 [Radiomyces spectabilis]
MALSELVKREHIGPIVSVAAAAAVAAYATFRRRSDSPYKKIPVAEGGWPYFGHLLSLGPMPTRLMAKWHEELGPIIQVNMGVLPYVMISDAEIAHEIFVTKGSVTSSRTFHTFTTNYYSLKGRGIVFASSDTNWKRTRTAALSILAPKRVGEFDDLIQNEADVLLESLMKATEREGGINPVKSLQAFSLNVILTTTLAKRVTSVDDPLFKEIIHVVDEGMKRAAVDNDISTFLPLLSFMNLFSNKIKNMEDFIKNKRDPTFKRLIAEALQGEQDCFVKSFYDSQYALTEDDILVTINDLLSAGSDTVSVTLSWAFLILSQHPEVQKKIRDEVDAFIKEHHRFPNFTERDAFPYLLSVQKECFRYRPISLFGIPHLTTEDVECRGYLIPKNTAITVNFNAVHLDAKRFPNPTEFIPERYIDNTQTMMAAANGKIEKRDHFNFGWGRRLCPGIHLAETELFYTWTRIFAKCVIEPELDNNGNPIHVSLDDATDAGLVILPTPYKVRFTPRTDALL